MRQEVTIKQDDFWRLLNREKFLLKYFNARLRYRIRMYSDFFRRFIKSSEFSSDLAATNNECVYVQVNCDDKTIGEHAEVNFSSFLKRKRSISSTYFFSNIFYLFWSQNIRDRFLIRLNTNKFYAMMNY